jgi:hypothetical protein
MAEEKEGKPAERRGIVVTGDEDGTGQKFIPAEVAEAAGIRVTGTTEDERTPADTEADDTPKRAAKKAASKKK